MGPCESEVYGSCIAYCRCEVVQGYHDMTLLVVSTWTLTCSKDWLDNLLLLSRSHVPTWQGDWIPYAYKFLWHILYVLQMTIMWGFWWLYYCKTHFCLKILQIVWVTIVAITQQPDVRFIEWVVCRFRETLPMPSWVVTTCLHTVGVCRSIRPWLSPVQTSLVGFSRRCSAAPMGS